jgi:hypothetical protein
MVFVGQRYAQGAGSAMVLVRCWSKRQRLDVGVIPHCFLLVLIGRLIRFSGFLSDFGFGWLDWFVGSVGLGWVLFLVGGFVEWLSSSVFHEFCWSNLDWFSGGGRC